MDSTQGPEDLFDQLFEGKSSNLPAPRKYTKTTERVDKSIRTVEDRLMYWQTLLNNWRIAISQNEQIITVGCILFGLLYSFAINECTGNFEFPIYVYVLVGIIVIVTSLLLIAEGGLPLLTIVQFGVSLAFGHVSMMFLVAVDGHYWQLFTTDVCRYPVTTDSAMVFIVGGGAGYMFAKFEEIRATGGDG